MKNKIYRKGARGAKVRREYVMIVCALALVMLCGKVSGQHPKASPITFTTKAPTRVAINKSYTYRFAATDSLGRTLRFSVKSLPAWLKYASSKNQLQGKATQAGQYPVRIEASVGGTTVLQSFMITVFDKQTVSILPLGNSITNGTDTLNSYRRPLWKMLHSAGYNFDMIGSWDKHHSGGAVPIPDFDMDHEGHSGWTAADLIKTPQWDSTRGNIGAWLQLYSPDIVLIELGTNDVFQCVSPDDILRNYSTVITTLRNKNDHVRIYIGSIIPLGARWGEEKYCGNYTLTQLLESVNERLKSFAREVSTDPSPVRIVDLFPAIDPKLHLYDDIHPNTMGEKIMAQQWFEAIRRHLDKLK